MMKTTCWMPPSLFTSVTFVSPTFSGVRPGLKVALPSVRHCTKEAIEVSVIVAV